MTASSDQEQLDLAMPEREDSDVDDCSSLKWRIQNAIFQERQKFYDFEAAEEVEDDSRTIRSSNSFSNRSRKSANSKAKSPIPRMRSQSEAGFNKRSVPSHFVDPADHADNVQKSLDNLAETFSSIFQFFLHNSPNISSETDPYEKEKKSRRCKEFEVRLSRMVYDLKRKLVATEKAILIFNNSPVQVPKLEKEADVKLYQTLRIANSILKAYFGHLPMAAAQSAVNPRGLLEALALLDDLCQECENLGYEVSETYSDVERLRLAVGKFTKENSAAKSEITFASNKPSPTRKIQRGADKPPISNMIDNFARKKILAKNKLRKFPSSRSPSIQRKKAQPQKLNLVKGKVTKPSGGSLRSALSSVNLLDTNEERQLENRESRSRELSIPRWENRYADNIPISQEAWTSTSDRQLVSSDPCPQQPFTKIDRGRNSVNRGRHENAARQRNPHSTNYENGHQLLLDLTNDDVNHILMYRHALPPLIPAASRLYGGPPCVDPLTMIGEAADKVAEHIVNSVCAEMSVEEALSQLLASELGFKL